MSLDLHTDDEHSMVFTSPENGLDVDNGYDFDVNHGGAGRKGRLLRLAGWIDLDNRVSVCVPLNYADFSKHVIDWMCWCTP